MFYAKSAFSTRIATKCAKQLTSVLVFLSRGLVPAPLVLAESRRVGSLSFKKIPARKCWAYQKPRLSEQHRSHAMFSNRHVPRSTKMICALLFVSYHIILQHVRFFSFFCIIAWYVMMGMKNTCNFAIPEFHVFAQGLGLAPGAFDHCALRRHSASHGGRGAPIGNETYQF